jgi:hypothetical protein
VSAATLGVRNGRLYRADHATFEHFCRERWGMSKTNANRFVQAAQVVENVTPTGVIPTSECQARPLTRLTPEEQPAA